MKTFSVIAAVFLLLAACNNASDEQQQHADTTSSLPAPATIDTGSLKPDTPKVEKALRK